MSHHGAHPHYLHSSRNMGMLMVHLVDHSISYHWSCELICLLSLPRWHIFFVSRISAFLEKQIFKAPWKCHHYACRRSNGNYIKGLGSTSRLYTGWEITFVICLIIPMQGCVHCLAGGEDCCKVIENSRCKLSTL